MSPSSPFRRTGTDADDVGFDRSGARPSSSPSSSSFVSPRRPTTTANAVTRDRSSSRHGVSSSAGAGTGITRLSGVPSSGAPAGASKLELTLSAVTSCEELARVLDGGQRQRTGGNVKDAAKTIDVVEHVLKRNRENLREFFSTCFQAILCEIFSFEGGGQSTNGWMNGAFNASEREMRELLEFLSPQGTFMRAMVAADSDKLVQFAFPVDRLPERTQRLLQTESGAMSLNRSPPYAGCIKRDSMGKYQVHLGLYQYFMFWTAYFAMRPGARRGHATHQSSFGLGTRSSPYKSAGGLGGGSFSSPSGAFLGGQWPSTPLSIHRSTTTKVHPYRELLLTHLKHFLPRAAPGKEWSKVDLGNTAQGELLVSILTEFWMPVDDSRAQSSDVTRSSSPFRNLPSMSRVVDAAMRHNGMTPPRAAAPESRRRYTYNPPAVDHVNAVTLLITYLFAELPDRQMENMDGTKGLDVARDIVQRPLYYFLHDAFTQWPTESMTSLGPVVTLWVSYFAPWCAKFPESQQSKAPVSKRGGSPSRILTSPLSKMPTASSSNAASEPDYDAALLPIGKEYKFDEKVEDTPGKYSHIRHVFKNIPFYHELMKHFLELCCKRVPLDAEGTASALLIALQPLASAPALLKLLESVEEGYAEFLLDPFKGTLKTMQAREESVASRESYYPLMRSQLQEWEPEEVSAIGGPPGTPNGTPGAFATPVSKWQGAAARLAANRVSESSKDKSVSGHLRMFSSEADGLAQVAIALIHRLERDSTQVPTSHPLRKSVPNFRKASFTVFRLERFRDTPYLKSPAAAKYVNTDSGERPGWASGRRSAREMYKGDWMQRPIGANEFAPLVSLLLMLSRFLNRKLRLDGAAGEGAKGRVTVGELKQLAEGAWTISQRVKRDNVVLGYAVSLLAVLEALTVGLFRSRGLTINLRPLAEYQMLALLFVAYWVLRFFRALLYIDLD